MWFDQCARFELDGSDLKLVVANKFLADGIARQFKPAIADAAREEVGHDVNISIEIRTGRSAAKARSVAPKPAAGDSADAPSNENPAASRPGTPPTLKE